MRASESAPDLLTEVGRGIEVSFANAQQLYEEAQILYKAGRLARALFLHQISLEECGKIEMMGAWATAVFLGLKMDVTKLSKAFRSHQAKNYANAYFAVVPDEEREARKRGDFKKASEAFSRVQKQIHEDMNNAKNAALYVDFNEKRSPHPQK